MRTTNQTEQLHQPMWGLLTNMVTTRRSTRLQEKQVAASAPSSPTPSNAQASPSTRRSRSATKATPPSSTRQRKATPTKSTGSGTRRGRPRKSAGSESDEAVAAQSDASSEPQEIASIVDEGEPAVQKQLFTDDAHHDTLAKDEASEPEAIEQVEEVAEVVEATAEVSEADEVQVVAERTTAVKVEEEPEPDSETFEEQVAVEEVPDEPNAAEAGDDVVQGSKPDEEEEEIVMMDSSDDEEEGDEEVAEKQTTEEASGDEDEEDIDVAAFAKMAATGIDFSSATKTQREPPPSSALSAKLVPDTLDSGASSRTKYLDFEGSKLGLGAKIVAQTASLEEQKVLGQQLSKIEKAKRQRAESTNVSTAGRKWFDMASHDLDADARRDFALLKMRNYLDPKKFYKTSDHTKKMPKHFQFGTVIEGAHEFKSARLTKKERKQTFTEEIMADEGIRSYTKRVFLQVQDKRAGGHGKKKKQKRL